MWVPETRWMSAREFDVDASTLFEMLADDRRRRLLFDLLDDQPQRPVRNPRERSPDGDGPAGTRMYHLHLPKLEAAGVVRWDRERLTVLRGPAFERARPLLETVREFSRGG